MGRRIPDDNASLSSLILHPVIYLWLVGVGVAASMAIVTSLCSVLFWKKTDPSLSSDDPSSSQESKPELDSELGGNKEETVTSPADVEDVKELPLPPAMLQPKEPHVPINMKRAASERKLAFNLSMKAINNLPRTLSVARLRDHQQPKKPKAEDSVWMKTIILGEKCQVNRDQEGEESAVIFEDKGKTVTAYHPRTKSSMSSSHFTYNGPDPDDDHDQQPPKSNDHDQQTPLPPPPQNQQQNLNQ